MKYKVEPFEFFYSVVISDYDPLIRFRIDFGGRLDVAALREAVTLSRQTIPMIACGFAPGRRNPHWVDRGLTGADMVREEAGPDDADILVDGFFIEPFDFRQGPHLKMLVLHRPAGDTLCIAISHLVCDVGGAKEYVALISRLYTAVAGGQTPPPQTMHPRGFKSLLKGISWGERRRIMKERDASTYYTEDFLKDRSLNFQGEDQRQFMMRRTLAEGRFDQLRSFTKAHDISVNDLLIAAVARAFSAKTARDRVTVSSTIDMRRWIPQDMPYGICNLCSDSFSQVVMHPDDKLADSAKQVSRAIENYREKKLYLKTIMALALFSRVRSYSKLQKSVQENPDRSTSIRPELTLSNFGEFTEKELSFHGLPVTGFHAFALTYLRNSIAVWVSTYEGKCVLTCNIFGPEEAGQFARDMLGKICEEIEGELTPVADKERSES